MTVAASHRTTAAWNLVTGTLAKYALVLISMVIGVVMMPFTVAHLGKADYGLWMLVASMTSYFQLLDLGYGNGLVRHVTEADAKGDVAGMNEVLSTFVVVYGVLGLVAMGGVALLVIFAVPRFPHLTPDQVWTGRIVLAFLGLRLAVGFPMTVFGAVTNARQRFAINSWVAVGVAVVNALVTYAVLVTGYGLVVLVPATVTVSILSYLAYAAVARHAFPQMRLAVAAFSRRRLRDVTAFSLYLFLISVAAQIGFNLDNLVIGAFMSTTAVAVYSVASRLADYQRQLCNQFNGLLFPIVVDFEARGDADGLRTMLVDGTRLATGLVVGVTVPLLAFARPLVVGWMGPGFEQTVPPLYALAVAGIVLVGQGPLGNILLVVGRHRLVAFGALAEALLNFAISVALVHRYGPTGVALGTMIAVVAVNVFLFVPVACRALGVAAVAFARETVVPAVAAAVPATVVACVLRMTVVTESLPMVLAGGAITGTVYLGAFGVVGLRRAERVRYARYARRVLLRERLAAA